ncbi:hypothetical protein [Ancylobacter vacuolatus]|uniref:Uncharacterized protein n=1 Tax=Ancylobacter vacuolatus TaxID=223389 RepID=A0ABU0DLU3_9HYPH|nr:hypothetical protein [Ancylobacter vacuolatus]MDQ0349395.1 hypothetical protein [Ancylobacter vacuolatus]
MTTTGAALVLHFDIPRMAAAEQALGMTIGAIVAEAQASDGVSLRVLRTLIAVGAALNQTERMLSRFMVFHLDDLKLTHADAAIKKHGVSACASAVGNALGVFLASITKEPA